MREGDLDAVRAIETFSFSNPWSDNTFRGEIQNTSISFPLVIVETATQKVVGYIVYWQIREDVQINNVAVHPDFRGRGAGETALRAVLDMVREAGATLVTLEVRLSNSAARNLYKKLGFQALGRRKDYYTNPDEDAEVLGLLLGEAGSKPAA
jgi:ribosomal-protein-alanine N-acetyltransferase